MCFIGFEVELGLRTDRVFHTESLWKRVPLFKILFSGLARPSMYAVDGSKSQKSKSSLGIVIFLLISYDYV